VAPNAPPSSDMENPDLGFPLEQHEWVGDSCDNVAFIKGATHHAANARDDQSQSSVFTGNLSFPHRCNLVGHLWRKRRHAPGFLVMREYPKVPPPSTGLHQPKPERLAEAATALAASAAALDAVLSQHTTRDGGDGVPPSPPDRRPSESAAAIAPPGLCPVTPLVAAAREGGWRGGSRRVAVIRLKRIYNF
jgi:hypothetical protein